LASALQQNPAVQTPLGWWMLSLFTASPLTNTPTEGAQSTSSSKFLLQAAERIASDFLEFVGKHDLHEVVLAMTPTQVQVVALFHAQLMLRPAKRVQLTERWEYLQQKPLYVPASEVQSPATPHLQQWQMPRRVQRYSRPPWSVSFAAWAACHSKRCGNTAKIITEVGASIGNASSSKCSSGTQCPFDQWRSGGSPGTTCRTCCTLVLAGAP
jgi:hypothetical protein